VLLPLISHEWGHHIQHLIDTGANTPLEQELQADCFAGAFIAFAADSDWISPVVAAMALQLTQSAGDVWWEGTSDEAIHGIKADRAMAFMAGQNGPGGVRSLVLRVRSPEKKRPVGQDPRGVVVATT
jgi:predicted metalloprotease